MGAGLFGPDASRNIHAIENRAEFSVLNAEGHRQGQRHSRDGGFILQRKAEVAGPQGHKAIQRAAIEKMPVQGLR